MITLSGFHCTVIQARGLKRVNKGPQVVFMRPVVPSKVEKYIFVKILALQACFGNGFALKVKSFNSLICGLQIIFTCNVASEVEFC